MPEPLEVTDANELEARRAIARLTPPRFLDFCDLIGVELTQGQREIAGVFYDGATPSSGEIWGADVVSGRAPVPGRSFVCVAVCGARGGKSYVLVALRALHGAMVRDLSQLAPGQEPIALIAAPDRRARAEVLRYARGACMWPVLSQNADGFRFERPDGRVVSVEAVVATAGGTALRGRWLTDGFFDECSFFRNSDYVVNDEELFAAASPRVLPGGQLVLASTPWSRSGLLWDFYKRNWGAPGDAVVAHAPTLVLRDNEQTREIVGRERRRDPENAAREYDARFPAADVTQFFSEELISRCVDAGVTKRTPLPREVVTAGADFGFERDSSAIATLHDSGSMYYVGEVLELMPTDDEPLKPSLVCKRFADVAKAHGAREIMADQHYRQAILEYIEAEGLDFANAPAGQARIAESYVRLRSLMQEGRIRLLDNPRLIAQLKLVTAKPVSGGGMSIQSPRMTRGGHGDIVSALVCAVWRAIGSERPEVKPPPNTREAYQLEADRMERDAEVQFAAAEGRSAWKTRWAGAERGAWRSRWQR